MPAALSWSPGVTPDVGDWALCPDPTPDFLPRLGPRGFREAEDS